MKYIILLSILLISTLTYAFKCELTDVIDGDTIRCNIQDLPDIFGKSISVRLKDCDSPEIRSTDNKEKTLGIVSKAELTNKIKNKNIELYNISRGKYFRLVADVYADGKLITCPNDKLAYSAPAFKCGAKTKCSQMSSCKEAYFYLNKCGLSRLDRDKDGIPCESICK